jgi:putative ABC transport system permease protein
MENYFAGEETFTVCGVYKDFVGTMMPSSDILSNPEYDASYSSGRMNPFSTLGQYVTLIKVQEGTDRETLAKKIDDICKENYHGNFVKSAPIYTMPELYFNPQQWFFHRGNKSVLQMLLVVVLLLLISAIFNYINLNLALSGKRAKEMATRRLLGALQGAIVWKYIGESILFTAVCFALALLLSWALLPMMNELLLNVTTDTGNTWMYIPVTLGLSAGTVAAYALAIVLIGTLVGLAPALFASRFAPIDIVRGTFRRRSKMVFGKVFIVFQNVVSVVLISMAIVMEVQLNHMMHRPLNARSEGLYSLGFYARDYSEVEPLVDRLNRIPEVKRVAYGRGFPGQMNM